MFKKRTMNVGCVSDAGKESGRFIDAVSGMRGIKVLKTETVKLDGIEFPMKTIQGNRFALTWMYLRTRKYFPVKLSFISYLKGALDWLLG